MVLVIGKMDENIISILHFLSSDNICYILYVLHRHTGVSY